MNWRNENPDLRYINGWGYCCNHFSISHYIHECKNMKIKKWQRKLMYLEIMYSYASSVKDVTLIFRRVFFLLVHTTYKLFNSLRTLWNWIIREINLFSKIHTPSKLTIDDYIYTIRWLGSINMIIFLWILNTKGYSLSTPIKNVYHKWIWKYFWNFYV